jgi:hypothetical protein
MNAKLPAPRTYGFRANKMEIHERAMPSDKELYTIIADEISTKTMDQALWTQALAIAEGNPNKAQAAYIKLRFVELRRSVAPREPDANIGKIMMPAAIRKDSELAQLRTDLARRLRAQGKSSFYEILGVSSDASDASIASAIQAMEVQLQEHGLTPEFRYAKETLGNPQARENYDRMMLDTLRQDTRVLNSSSASYSRESGEGSWWNTTKTSVLVGVAAIAVVGYLGLGFFKEKGGQTIQERAIDMQRDALKSSTDIIKSTTDGNQANTARVIDAAQEAREREMDIREQQVESMRESQERRDELQREQFELQKQQMANQQQQRQEQTEKIQQQREKQFWACVNQQINVYQPSGTTAMSRCAYLRP